MKSVGKCLLAFLFILLGNAAFSTKPVHAVSQPADSYLVSNSLSQNTPADFPSHGYAMLILRYNDDSKGKIFSFLLSNSGVFCIAKLKPVVNDALTYSTYSPYLPEKMLRYEAFLYSLPLRSPPAFC